VAALCALSLADAATAAAADLEAPIGSYPLDGIARVVPKGAALPCARGELVIYRGEQMRFSRPARVHAAFRGRLQALEQLVAETATAVYGRAPRRLLHLGTHNCRRIRLYPDFLSEHALGNAIDLAGFDFGPLPRGAALPSDLPRALRRGFEVRVDRHWNASEGTGAIHRRFWHTLAQRLIAREDLFRVVLGPAWPGHHNHLHLDVAPYRMVEVF
jgi:hypothetical protein